MNLYLHTAILLFCFCIGCVHHESSNSSAGTIWIEDGKTGSREVEDIPMPGIHETYFETLQRVSYWNVGKSGAPEERRPYLPQNLTVTQIGHWGAYDVFDITNQKERHKSIVLKDRNGKYRILYTQFSGCTADVADLPEIFEISGESILSYRTSIPGTGHFYIEYYFIYDKEKGRIFRIDTETPINETLEEVLPVGYGVWKGEGLDFKKMTFSSPVWKRGDCNANATGGKINMKLSLENGELPVVKSEYISDR